MTFELLDLVAKTEKQRLEMQKLSKENQKSTKSKKRVQTKTLQKLSNSDQK